MTELAAIAGFLKSSTPTGYMLVAIGLWIAWKISALVPTIIDTWEKRSTGIEARLQASMLAYTERMDKQLELSDEAHKACQEETNRLRNRVNQQDGIIAQQNDTIAKQSATIAENNITIVKLSEQVAGLRTSHLQTQMTIAEEKDDLSPAMHRAIGHLKEIK